MQSLRHWSTRHAAGLKRVYDACSRYAPYLGRAVRVIGLDRAERTLVPLKYASKALFFDCKMCGQCALSSTGMIYSNSAKALLRMAQSVPGVSIPEPLLQRIENAADQRAEGKAMPC